MSSNDETIKTIKAERIKSLDGLRAIAVLMVLMAHSTIYHASDFVNDSMFPHVMFFFLNGWVGVELFFVLSGFLLTSQLLKRDIDKTYLKRYFIKRFFRIAPAYYVAVISTFIFLHGYNEFVEHGFLVTLSKWWLVLISHFFFVHDYVAKFPYIDGIFWSIPVEIKFYLLLPFLLLGLSRLSYPHKRIISIIALYASYFTIRVLYLFLSYDTQDLDYLHYFFYVRSPFHMALDGLFIGVICAMVLRHSISKKIKGEFTFIAGFFGFCVLMYFPHVVNEIAKFHEYSFITGLYSICFGFMLIGLILGCRFNSFFEIGAFSFLAKISYSIYLTQIFALYFQGYVISRLGLVISDGMTSWLISLPFLFLFSFLISCMLYFAVEKPFINWAHTRVSRPT